MKTTKFSYIFAVCYVSVALPVSLVKCYDEDKELILDLTDVDRSEYIDPFDMFNYDTNTRPRTDNLINMNQEDRFETRSRLPVQREVITNSLVIEDNTEPPVVKKHLSLLKNNLDSQQNCVVSAAGGWEKPFLLRFVLILSNLLTIKDRTIIEGENMEIPVVAILNKQSKLVIEDILELGENIPPSKFADLDEVLSNMFKLAEQNSIHPERGSSLFQILAESINYHAKDWLVVMYLFCISYIFKLVLCGHSPRSIILRSIIPLLVTSWYWHWHHLDQQASAKRQSDLAKASQPPAACNPETLDTWGSIKLFVSTTFLRNPDPCEEYHKALFTDPSFEVNPLAALTDLLAISIFTPLRYIGEQTGGFFDGVLSSTNFFTMIPVFLAVLAVILIGFFMMFGYELHTPLFKITSKTPLTGVQLQSAVHTQVLLENRAFQALQMQRRAELGVLESANLALPRIQPVYEDASSSIIEKDLPRKETHTPVVVTRKEKAVVDSPARPSQDCMSTLSHEETQNDERHTKREPNQEDQENAQNNKPCAKTEPREIENLSSEQPKETAIVE